MPLFVMNAIGGQMGLLAARDEEHAEDLALRRLGTDHFDSVREATAEDLVWVSMMGGRVPRDPYKEDS